MRIAVPKTYKMFVNGAFVRSERGYVLPYNDQNGQFVAYYPHASRKDARDAIGAARKAQSGWAKRTAFNRGQILYRFAEMMEDRRAQWQAQLMKLAGYTAEKAGAEVTAAIDGTFWYAGWADKLGTALSSVNPIAGPYFNFTTPEPVGLVAIFPAQNAPLLSLMAAILPVIVAGNTAVVVVEAPAPLLALELGEVLAISDVPAGVVNILTGSFHELAKPIAAHMDVNAMAVWGASEEVTKQVEREGAENMKRIHFENNLVSGDLEECLSLYKITPYLEFKTAWHPIGV